jgi:uncharacterized protein
MPPTTIAHRLARRPLGRPENPPAPQCPAAPVPARLSRLPSSSPLPGLTLYEAATRRGRAHGLAGLAELPAASALRLAPCRSVHTFGMRFALDLLWLGADGRVLRVDEAVTPRRVRTCLRARAVIEARAGEAPRFLTCFRVS